MAGNSWDQVMGPWRAFFTWLLDEMSDVSSHSPANLEETVNEHLKYIQEGLCSSVYVFHTASEFKVCISERFFLILMIWSLRSVNTDKYFKQLRKVNVGVQWTCPSRHPMPFDKPLNLSLLSTML